MMNENEMINGTLDDLVFEDRNKEYGAYMLRKEYAKNQLAAFLLSMLVFVVLIAIAYWPKQAMGAETIVEHKTVTTVLEAPPALPDAPKPRAFKIPAPKAPKYVTPKVTTKEVPDDKKLPKMTEVIKSPSIDNHGLSNLPNIGKGGFGTGPVEIRDKVKPKKPKVYIFVSEPPRFKGGDAAMYTYLQTHTKYPEIARQLNIQGTVYITFVVAADGSIHDVKLKHGIDKDLNIEAKRVIKGMPDWIPGKSNGKPVNVRCSLPIDFKVK